MTVPSPFLLRRRLLLGSVALLLPWRAVAQESAPMDRFRAYTLPGTPLTLAYPADLFEPATAEADSARFLSRDGQASFIVTTAQNSWTMEALVRRTEQSLRERGVGDFFRRVERDWFVMSGATGGRIFYYKLVLVEAGSRLGTLEVLYPRAEQERYRPIVAHMSRSFQPVP